MTPNPTVTQTKGTSLPPELLLIDNSIRGKSSF